MKNNGLMFACVLFFKEIFQLIIHLIIALQKTLFHSLDTPFPSTIYFWILIAFKEKKIYNKNYFNVKKYKKRKEKLQPNPSIITLEHYELGFYVFSIPNFLKTFHCKFGMKICSNVFHVQ